MIPVCARRADLRTSAAARGASGASAVRACALPQGAFGVLEVIAVVAGRACL